MKNQLVHDATLLSDIEKVIRNHTDCVTNMMIGVVGRLQQLESRSRQLEISINEVKALTRNNHGATFAKLWQIDNVVREVKDQHEVLETHLQSENQILDHIKSTNPFDVFPPFQLDPYYQTSSNPYELPQLLALPPPPQQPQPIESAPPLLPHEPLYSQQPFFGYEQPFSGPTLDISSQYVTSLSSASAPHVPQACVTSSAVGSGSLSSLSNSEKRDPIDDVVNKLSNMKVPKSKVREMVKKFDHIDDVVNKVSNMGFPKSKVRDMVKKLIKTGETVDLNVVLDKLMTDGVKN